MKWDASVRKKQIQLRAQAKHFDRDGVVGLLMDEAVKAGTDEIAARFHELAVARGFEEKREEVKEEDDVLTQIATLAQAKAKNTFSAIFKRDELEIPEGGIVTPRAEGSDVTTAQLVQKKNEHDASLTAIRRAAMIRGMFVPELYKNGETFSESLLRFSLAAPDPSVNSISDRIRAFDEVMTYLKAEDMLMELPSKRLLLKYVLSSHWKDDMQVREENSRASANLSKIF